jgi:hypothetical protein
MKRNPALASFKLALLMILLIGVSKAQSITKSDNKQTTAAQAAKPQSSALIDLNSATKEQLSALPGIGAVHAQKIIDNRPYKTKADLVRKKVIPQSVYNRISARVVAKQQAANRPQTGTPQPAAASVTPTPTETPRATESPAKAPRSSAAPAQSAPSAATQKASLPTRPIVLTGAPMGGVKFEHTKHKVNCSNCHHNPREPNLGSVPQQACTSCHTKPPQPGMKTAKQAAFHNPTASAGTCIDCHKKSGGNAPTKCVQCHKKENA